MGRRLALHEVLKGITDNVYFVGPPNTKMAYPCIIYSRDDARTKFAGNRPYSFTQRYQVTVVDPDPDSDILDQMAALPMCLFDRHYVADNLDHDVFVLYF